MQIKCNCGEDVTKVLEAANKKEQDFAVCPSCKSKVYGMVAVIKPKDNRNAIAIKETTRNASILFLVLVLVALCNILSRWFMSIWR